MKLALLTTALVVAAQAHEIGTTRVSAVFQNGTYDVAVDTDTAALLEKLQAVTGSTSQDLRTYEEVFRSRVKLEFGGIAATPAIAYGDTIHFTGPIPTGAQEFAWTFGWTFATYFLSAGNGTQWIEGADRSTPVALGGPAQTISSALRYLRLGFTHIVPNGFDHMLFVLGIYLLSRRARSVLLQVSAFTLAHSITLGLSLYGLVSVSPAIVEPLIALSIAYVAIENLFLSELKPWRVALVFAFGLLHGLGFAGALRELELPRSEFATALVAFNVGVEAGQLAVIGAAFVLVGWYCSRQDWYRTRVALPASALIASVAVFWTIQRTW
jgi:hydrogenase/urease accessory protein HupE